MPTKSSTKKKHNKKDDLLSVLVSIGGLSQDKSNKIREEANLDSNQDYFDYLKSNNQVDEGALLRATSILFNLERVNIGSRFIDDQLLSLVSEDKARKHKLIIYDQDGDRLKIALNNPYKLPQIDKEVIEPISNSKKDYQFEFKLVKLNDIKAALSQYNRLKNRKSRKKIEVQEKKDDTNVKSLTHLSNNLLKTLVRQSVISSTQAEKFQEQVEKENLSIENFLEQKGIDRGKIQKAKADQKGLELVDLSKYEISQQVVERIPYDIASKHQLVAYDEIGDRILKVASLDPSSKAVDDVVNFAQTKKGIDIKLALTTPENIDLVLKKYPQRQEQKKEIGEGEQTKEVKFNKKKKDYDIRPDQSHNSDRTNQEDLSILPEEKSIPKIRQESDQLEVSVVDSSQKELKGRITSLIQRKVNSEKELDQIINKGSVPRIVAGIVNFALSKRASDVHIQPTDKDSLLRYRIDGVLNNITKVPRELHSAIISRIKILSKLRIDEKRVPQDGRFEVDFENREIDLRVSTMPTTNNEKVVLRLLDKSRKDFNLEDLGLKGSSYNKLVKNIEKPYGMIVATGPTGSGKSTTLYAAMSKINQPKINIITLEDPIEYELNGVSQSQARPDIGYSFANGLRSVLRQDPDVIMVGEIRDKETAEMAIHAALTGHLLFTTLHTNDAAGAIPRLIDMGIEPFLISSASNVFLAQRLVRRVCPDCKQKDPNFNSEAKKKIKSILSDLPESEKDAVPSEKDWQIYRGKGCSKCYQGYRGRIGIFEVLQIDEKIRSMIHEDVSIGQIRKQAIKDGMVTMEQDGVIKVLKGQTTLEEIFRVTGVVEEQF